MDTSKLHILLDGGQKKVFLAQKLLSSLPKNTEFPYAKVSLLSLRNWFYDNAHEIKEAMHADSQLNKAKRKLLEKLICRYTILIMEIDEKIQYLTMFEPRDMKASKILN